MTDKKISALTAASTPLAGTEVLPIVQSSATVKVAVNDLTVKNIRSNATTGILQVTGPAAASTRVMTTPDANFTAARTDAAQTFTGDQTVNDNLFVGTTTASGSASNSKVIAGGRFITVAGSVSAANATSTTLFTAPTGLGAYLVTVNVDADATAYAATYLINTQGGSATVATLIFKGALVTITVSGYDVKVTQTSGTTATVSYSAIRIA
jgi:hypothetical protein